MVPFLQLPVGDRPVRPLQSAHGLAVHGRRPGAAAAGVLGRVPPLAGGREEGRRRQAHVLRRGGGARPQQAGALRSGDGARSAGAWC